MRGILNQKEEIRFKFLNNPPEKTLDEYREAINAFIHRISPNEDILSVYKSKSGVSVPGISDIDLIIILKDEVIKPKALRRTLSASIMGYEDILELDVMDKDTFKSYYIIFPYKKKLIRLYGERIEVKSLLNPNYIISYLVDMLNKTYPHEFLDMLFFPKYLTNSRVLNLLLSDLSPFIPKEMMRKLNYTIDVRNSTRAMNGLKNNLSLFEGVGAPDTNWREYKRGVEELRNNWFGLNNREEMLIQLLKNSISVCFELIEEMSRYLYNNGLLIDDREGILNPDDLVFNRQYPNYYKKNWNKEEDMDKTVYIFKNLRMKSCILPSSLLINENVRKGLIDSLDKNYVNILLRRDKAIKKRTEYLSKYRFHRLREPYLHFLKHLYNTKAKFMRRINEGK